MLERLQGLLKPRYIAAAAALFFLPRIFFLVGIYPRRWYHQALYPPQRAAPDAEILSQAERQQARRLEDQYRRVTSLIEEARANGFAVNGLQDQADAALKFNVPGKRTAAAEILYRAEMQIPHRKVQYIPMDAPAHEAKPAAAQAKSRHQRKRRVKKSQASP
jgi:hypothetical protein